MPRGASKQKTRPRKAKGITVKLEGTIPIVYANFASVSHTPQELILDFCLVAPPYDFDEASQKVMSRVSMRVVTPIEFGSALVDAISTQLKKIESERSQPNKLK